ncbi:hypothetical protein J6590_014765 [Homalodisca vitripennis]|nr:hypothetical protein J6590_014765 [Homalodisca vitripennis]
MEKEWKEVKMNSQNLNCTNSYTSYDLVTSRNLSLLQRVYILSVCVYKTLLVHSEYVIEDGSELSCCSLKKHTIDRVLCCVTGLDWTDTPPVTEHRCHSCQRSYKHKRSLMYHVKYSCKRPKSSKSAIL